MERYAIGITSIIHIHMNCEKPQFIQIFILCNRPAPFSLPLATIYVFIINAHAILNYFKFPLMKHSCAKPVGIV